MKYAISNWFYGDGTLRDQLAQLARQGYQLINMHISDCNRVAPGYGHFNFSAMLVVLRALNYREFLTFEPVLPWFKPLTTQMKENYWFSDIYFKESIDHLKK